MDTSQTLPMTLRAAEAAKFLSIGKSTLYRWIADGRLPPGRRLLNSKIRVWLVVELMAVLDRSRP